jgi:hypothetical protein
MRFLAQLLCAFSLVAAKPIEPLATTQRLQRVPQNHAQELVLSDPQAVRHTSSFDAAPNSVGLIQSQHASQR